VVSFLTLKSVAATGKLGATAVADRLMTHLRRGVALRKAMAKARFTPILVTSVVAVTSAKFLQGHPRAAQSKKTIMTMPPMMVMMMIEKMVTTMMIAKKQKN
jgi:hypothetical protein